MTDEKFTFTEDVREKKLAARSSRNKNRGKGGAVRFPSDNLTKKEFKAMSSEVTYFRMNDPMKWAEFKKMPDDLKIAYIKYIREKFGATDKAIGDMLGVSVQYRCKVFAELGLCRGKAAGGKQARKKWDEEAFNKWAYGEAEEAAEPEPRVTLEEQKIAPVSPGSVVAEPGAIAIEFTQAEFDSLLELLETGLYTAMNGAQNANTLNRICDLCEIYKKVKNANGGKE